MITEVESQPSAKMIEFTDELSDEALDRYLLSRMCSGSDSAPCYAPID